MIGHCNICSAHGALTRDHVPPKGSVKITQMISLDLIASLGQKLPRKPQDSKKWKMSQNGVHFKSLCAACNNGLLGTELDPAFNEFVAIVYEAIRESTPDHSHIRIACNPHKIARAFLGHMAAALSYKGSEFLRINFGRYIQGKDKLPEEAKIYCWPFPYKTQAIVPYNSIVPGLTKRGYKGVLITWSLKFAPVAFMIIWKQSDTFKLPGHTLLCDSTTPVDNGASMVDFELSRIPQHWPEAPGPDDVVMSSSESPGWTSFPYKNERQR